jgi:hypothetical protein
MRHFRMTRPAVTTGDHPLPASRGANAIQSAGNIVRPSLVHRSTGSGGRGEFNIRLPIPLPSGSLSVSPFEISNSLQTSIDIGVAMFWIAYFLIILTGLGLSCWALLKAIHLL